MLAKRIAMLAIVVLVGIATWATVHAEGTESVPKPRGPDQERGSAGAGEGPVDVPVGMVNRRVVTGTEAATRAGAVPLADDPGELEVEAVVGQGGLNGYVIDQFTGRPLSDYTIRFIHTTEERERSTRVDESGFYGVSLDAGEWTVLVQDAQRRIRTTSGRCFGPFEIVADVTATQDLLLVGDRKISGNLALSAEGIGQPEKAASLLFLRLLNAETRQVIGMATTETYATPPWESDTESEGPVDVERYKMGAFAFSFIEPGSYRLQVSTSPGFRARRKGGEEFDFYVELELEVGAEDVSVPDRVISVQEIASASLLRARGAE